MIDSPPKGSSLRRSNTQAEAVTNSSFSEFRTQNTSDDKARPLKLQRTKTAMPATRSKTPYGPMRMASRNEKVLKSASLRKLSSKSRSRQKGPHTAGGTSSILIEESKGDARANYTY